MKRIVIDLDHTLINYGKLLHKTASKLYSNLPQFNSKEDLKSYLKENLGEEQWRKVQGICYGKKIFQASLFTGAKSCLSKLKNNNYDLFIVSHKSSYSYCNDKLPLRAPALKFLKRNKITPQLIAEDKVIFCNSAKDKIETINKLQPLIVIDDLYEIHLATPETSHILFSNQISSDFLSLHNWNDISTLLNNALLKDFDRFDPISKHNKNQLLRVESSQQSSIVKIFCDPARAQRESHNLRLLQSFKNVPRLLDHLKKILILSDHSSDKPKCIDVSDVIDFFKQIARITNPLKGTHFRPTISHYKKQIIKRIKEIGASEDLILIFNQLYTPLTQLPRKHRVVNCYADFCLDDVLFHNDELIFIDFESMGMNDPAKFACDLILHPRNQANLEIILPICAQYLQSFPNEVKARFQKVLDLVAFEWLLIQASHFEKKSSTLSKEQWFKRIEQLKKNIRKQYPFPALTADQRQLFATQGLISLPKR